MRFRKYSEPFIRGCFGDLIFLRKEKYDPQKDTATYPCIELENIEQETCLLNGYFDSKKQKSIKTKFQSGDVLFGKLRPYLRKYALVDFNGVCSTEIWALYSNKLLNSYLFYYIQTEQFLEVANTSSGTKMPRAEWNLISSKEFRYPQSREEMGCVSHFLSKIDQRIETQSKIIEKLQSQMLAIYHQVFSQLNSEVLPLVKLCSIQKGAQVNGIELLENGPYYFMNGGIVPSGFYNDWNTETNTISISEGGNSCGYVQYNKERFWSGGHCYTLQKLNKVSVRYLYHFLKSYEKDIMRLRIGTGLPNIQKKDLEQFLIKVPSLLEQERLVKLLDSFELKIGTEEKLFKKYKEQKKFLLSNMFI